MLPRPLGRAAVRVLSPLVAAGLLLLAAGCASTPAEDAPSIVLPASRPVDFTLTLTVTNPGALAQARTRVRGPQAPASAVPSPRAPTVAPELRPGRYIIEPDGFLRAALGPGATERTYPPPIRRLTAEQLDEIYALVSAPNGLGAGGVVPPGSSAWTDPVSAGAPSPPGYQFTLLADRQRFAVVRPLNDRTARTAAGILAKWAWQGD